MASRRGAVIVKARVTHEVLPGMVWMAFHFRENCANWLTNPAFDPVTLTAEYKACAVRIEKLGPTTIKPDRTQGLMLDQDLRL